MALRRSGVFAYRQLQLRLLQADNAAIGRALKSLSEPGALPAGLIQAGPRTWESQFGYDSSGWRALHHISSPLQQAAQPAVAEEQTSHSEQQQQTAPQSLESQDTAKTAFDKVRAAIESLTGLHKQQTSHAGVGAVLLA